MDRVRLIYWVRVALLFCAMLMSGGMLFLPRLPLLAALIALFLIVQRPTTLLRREFLRIGLLLLAIFAVALIADGTLNLAPAAIRLVNFAGGLLMLATYVTLPRDQLAHDLVPLGRLFSVQAILTVVLARLVPGAFVPVQLDDLTYHTIGFVFTYHDLLVNAPFLKRPDGFFFEPGVLQIYLNLFLYVALFVTHRRVDAGLAVVGILSTQSTTGLLIMLVILGFASLRWLQRAGVTGKAALALLIPIIILPIGAISYANFIQKTEGAFRGSSWAREYDLYTGWRVAVRHPLVGIGFDHERYYAESGRYGYFESRLDADATIERATSNGLIMVCYMLGFPMALLIFVLLYRQRFFRDKILMWLILMLSLSGEALTFTPFFVALIFSGALISSASTARRNLAGPARTARAAI